MYKIPLPFILILINFIIPNFILEVFHIALLLSIALHTAQQNPEPVRKPELGVRIPELGVRNLTAAERVASS